MKRMTIHDINLRCSSHNDLSSRVDFLGLRAVLGPMAHLLTVEAGGAGHVAFASGPAAEHLHDVVLGEEGIVPGAESSVVPAVVLVPVGVLTSVGTLARSESVEPLLFFSGHGGVPNFDDFGGGGHSVA